MKAKVEILQNQFLNRLDEMVKRAKTARAYLNRVVYAQYRDAQIERWNSENQSEGERWKELNPLYFVQKRRRYAAYPYSGFKTLVATGTLLKAVVGSEGRYHRKIVDDFSLEIRVTLPYAPFVNRVRPFMIFGRRTRKVITDGMRKYMLGRRY